MTRRLQLGPSFSLPIDAATDSQGILAKKGAGKSNAAVVMAEELHAAGVPFVAIDPKGDWFGIRSSADGDKPGLPIPVFGGKHADVPLAPTEGAMLADVILGDEDRGYLACVVDVSHFTISEQRRFLLAFGERLFRAKDEERVLHLFLEEAHEYLPQSVPSEARQLVSTWQRIVKQGRFKGLGVTIVSQRSAALNKDVLTQVDSLYVLRTMSPQDRAAVKGWVEVHVGSSELLATLHELQAGEAWLWSPERFAEPQRFQFRRRRTFDSGATPKVGEVRRAPARLADVDLAAIKEQMAESIERAKADDPRELRRLLALAESLALARGKQIAQLEERLAAQAEPQQVEVSAVPAGLLDARVDLLEHLTGAVRSATLIGSLVDEALDAGATIAVSGEATPRRWKAPTPPASHQPDNGEKTRRAPAAASPRPSSGEPDGRLGKAERAVLTVLASYPAGKNRRQLAALAGLRASGGHFGNVLSKLRTVGRIVGEGAGIYQATDEGLAALGPWEPLPTGPALLDWWVAQLGRAHAEVLRVLVAAWPEEVARSELAEQVGIDASGGHFGNVLSQLRVRDLIVGSSRLRADDDFMAAVNA